MEDKMLMARDLIVSCNLVDPEAVPNVRIEA
jgi:hypothetical protein